MAASVRGVITTDVIDMSLGCCDCIVAVVLPIVMERMRIPHQVQFCVLLATSAILLSAGVPSSQLQFT